jgi:hypothetical protein
LADVEDQNTVEIWPDNWPAIELFEQLDTQWLVGPGGAYGLNYSSLQSTLSMLDIERDRWADLFSDIRILEASALKQMSSNRS